MGESKIKSKLACKNCKFCHKQNYSKPDCVTPVIPKLERKDPVVVEVESKDPVGVFQSK
jgi:hypothetical protein